MTKREALEFSTDEFLKRLETSVGGLSQDEAARRTARYGANVFAKKSPGMLAVLARQFRNSLIYLLIMAGVIAYAIGDYSDGTIILAILFINASLGFYQEYKSGRVIEKLSRLINKKARLLRGGALELVDEADIVPGDYIVIREGDIVPADVRLIEDEGLLINESALTGESVPVGKRAPRDRGARASSDSIILAGSIVEKGEGKAIVYATGGASELGTIAALSTAATKETQYEKSLEALSSYLMRVILAGLLVIFCVKLILTSGRADTSSLLLFIIALAVSTIPEALPVIATVTLSAGAIALGKRHVVVKRLSALEDLGNVNLLCTDKTGTITENKMAVRDIVSPERDLFERLAYAAITPIKNRKIRKENSYDEAFLAYMDYSVRREAKAISIVKELPFDPEARRHRVVLYDSARDRHYLAVIGAPEAVFPIVKHERVTRDRGVIAEEGARGLHHLAMAYKPVEYAEGFDIFKNERDLTYLGYVSFVDPIRSGVRRTLSEARRLGVEVKILTGDGSEVAGYIGREIGIIKEGEKVLSGDDLRKMDAVSFRDAVETHGVFARVTPEDKHNIIKTLKEKHVVAYQGDGINDAPALKLADVGIAVNSSTDIAKESADIVILNKSLDVVVSGIKSGRSIFVNINKYIRYAMANNFGVFAALAILFLFSSALPILPVQALLNNLLGDIPHVIIASDTVESDEVVRPERHNMKELLGVSLLLGLPTALFGLGYFAMIRFVRIPVLQTSLYVFFTLQALIIFFAVRSKRHFWRAKAPSFYLDGAFAAAFAVSLGVIYVPLFQKWFSFVPLPASSIWLIIALLVCYLIVVDYLKVWYYKVINYKS